MRIITVFKSLFSLFLICKQIFIKMIIPTYLPKTFIVLFKIVVLDLEVKSSKLNSPSRIIPLNSEHRELIKDDSPGTTRINLKNKIICRIQNQSAYFNCVFSLLRLQKMFFFFFFFFRNTILLQLSIVFKEIRF